MVGRDLDGQCDAVWGVFSLFVFKPLRNSDHGLSRPILIQWVTSVKYVVVKDVTFWVFRYHCVTLTYLFDLLPVLAHFMAMTEPSVPTG